MNDKGAAIDNEPLTIEDYKGALGLLNDENAELQAKIEYLEGYSKAQDERIAELSGALTALVSQTYPTMVGWARWGCTCAGEGKTFDEIQHAPDCAWEHAGRLV